MKKWKEFVAELPTEVTCTKREIFGTVLIGTLVGVILGMLISPRNTRWFGCYNGNTWNPEAQEEEEADE